MEFNTVDGFQGREVDILLLSTVRASGSCDETSKVRSSNIGFVADVRRMNVALTRAKLSLWVFGNARTLRTNQTWASLLEDAKQRNLIVSARKPYSSIHKFCSANRSSAGNSLTTQFEEDERLKAAGGRGNPASERKRKCSGGEVPCSRKDAATDVKRRTKFLDAKETASVKISNREDKVLKGKMLELQDNQDKKTSTSPVFRENKKQSKVVRADVVKGSNDNNVRTHSTDTGKEKSRRSQKHIDAKIGTSSSERRVKEKGEREAPAKAEILNDTIKKRKQQREAVDALLSSALISSKKPGSLVKRTL